MDAQITLEQIADWKAKYGAVHIIEVAPAAKKYDKYLLPEEADEAIPDAVVGYLKHPDNRILSFALGKLPNFIDAGIAIVRNCWLGGDRRILDDPALLNSAGLQASELIETHQARLKKA